MKQVYLLGAMVLLAVLPLCVVAVYPEVAQGAGFAKESLFLSKTPVVEGDTVLIHAVVANESATTFTGEVVFSVQDGSASDGKDKIGAVAVMIAPGGANAVSVSWKPSAGSHTIVAELADPDGAVVEKQSASFTINAKPEPASAHDQAAAAVESSQNIQNSIGQYSPAAASTVKPVFEIIDSLRAKAADSLDAGIDWAKEKTGGKKPTGRAGEVLGSSTADTTSSGIIGTLWNILALIALYTFTILRFIVGSAGIFYPVFAIIFFYFLWRTFKHFRRPSY